MANKSLKTLARFTLYCLQHPEQRFWQALRNWARDEDSDAQFILKAKDLDLSTGQFVGIKDTFYE